MKSLKEYIYEKATDTAYEEKPEEVTVESVAEEFGVTEEDVRKGISYIKHNNPSWQSFDTDNLQDAGIKEPEKKEGENQEPYLPKVLDALKKLHESGYFEKATKDDSEEKKEEE